MVLRDEINERLFTETYSRRPPPQFPPPCFTNTNYINGVIPPKWPKQITGTWKTSKNEFSDDECPNVGAVHKSLQNCKDICLETPSCTAFNYNKITTSCVMRGCSLAGGLPVVPPANNNNYDGFWLPTGSIRLDTYVCCFLLAPSGALKIAPGRYPIPIHPHIALSVQYHSIMIWNVQREVVKKNWP